MILMNRKIAALLAASLFGCQAEPAPVRSGQDAAADSAPATDAADAGNAARPSSHASRDTANGRAAVLFLGTSLTAGYGVGADEAYPALLQARIDSAGLPYRVVNAGLSGETTAGGLARLDWSLQDSVAVLVLELGANDGLRGLPVEQMRANLDEILRRTRARYPAAHVVITGMEAPPNLGPEYTRAFRATYRALALEYDAALVPFLLDGVAAVPELNQADGIHPNAAGHRVLADHVWEVLEPVLAEAAAQAQDAS